MSTLRRVQSTRHQKNDSGFIAVPIPSPTDSDTKKYFSEFVAKLQDFDQTINHQLSSTLGRNLREQLHKTQKKQLHLLHRYLSKIKPRTKLSRSNPDDSFTQTLQHEMKLALYNEMDDLNYDLDELQVKAQFIRSVEEKSFRYCNAAQFNLKETDDVQSAERVLTKNLKQASILCSNDTLNNNDPSTLNQLMHQLTEQRHSNLARIYADFSYCSVQLPEMMVLSSNKKRHQQTSVRPLTRKHSASSTSTTSKVAIPDKDVANVLLLGETGVGKSTFINAFVNYLTFDTLAQAENNQPVVLIPVSFLITTGETFEERVVQFGQSHKPTTEHFDHPGQSVTQHCKSYLFDLNRIHRKKLRIIDTPGFGDTRGLDQDDKNMQHILQYVRTLTHLNAVCFLLKSNTSRLHIFFRSCLTQLLDLLGPNAHEHLLFCFTNARSTFYTPGDTAPLLRTMLSSLQMQRPISLKKENTFCFDNESFRYLVARQNGIEFDSAQRHEYETSWSTSVKESRRLLNCVHTQHTIHSVSNGSQTPEHAVLEITQMVRPILETIRNILRNMILLKTETANKSIELCPQGLRSSSTCCLSCKGDAFSLGSFWILPDDVHSIDKKCLACSCPPDQHIPLDYLLSYQISNNLSYYREKTTNGLLKDLNLASAKLAYFLNTMLHTTKPNPFLAGFVRMVEEEKHICAEQTSNHLNLELVEQLKEVIFTYEEHLKAVQLNHKEESLQTIYDLMNTVCEYPIVREQMAAIRRKGTPSKNEVLEVEAFDDPLFDKSE